MRKFILVIVEKRIEFMKSRKSFKIAAVFSVERDFDYVAFCEGLFANWTELLGHFIQTFQACWMSTLQNAELAISSVVFFKTDVASFALDCYFF